MTYAASHRARALGAAVVLMAAVGLLAASCSSVAVLAPVASSTAPPPSASASSSAVSGTERSLSPATSASASALSSTAPSSSSPASSPQPAGTSNLDQALALIPTAATDVDFVDLARAKARWGFSVVNGSTSPDNPARVAFTKKLYTSAAYSGLDQLGPGLKADAAWDGTDVEWNASWRFGDLPVQAFRLRDGLDMNVVIDSLTKDGMTRSGTDDAIRFENAGIGGTFRAVFLHGVTVIPSQHLLVAAEAKSWTRPAEESSVASLAVAADLLSTVPAGDYVQLEIGSNDCRDVADLADTLGDTTTEAKKKIEELLAAHPLKPVVAWIVSVSDDGHAIVDARYQDAVSATADLASRRALLAGNSVFSKVSYSKYYTAALTAQGPDLVYNLILHSGAGQLRSLVEEDDAAWAFC